MLIHGLTFRTLLLASFWDVYFMLLIDWRNVRVHKLLIWWLQTKELNTNTFYTQSLGFISFCCPPLFLLRLCTLLTARFSSSISVMCLEKQIISIQFSEPLFSVNYSGAFNCEYILKMIFIQMTEVKSRK